VRLSLYAVSQSSSGEDLLAEMLSLEVFTSNEEINTLNRYVEPLPVTLDSLKYLRNDSDYLFVSEYLAMDTLTPSNNVLSFTVTVNQTSAKFYLESSDIYLTLRRPDNATFLLSSRSPLFSPGPLTPGIYSLFFEFPTAVSKPDPRFRLTILLLAPDFLPT
jgi:hypothetical protein